MQEEHLAIASVPVQKWGELFSEKDALRIGTVFKDLNKPFFATVVVSDEEKENMKESTLGKSSETVEKDQLLKQIMEISFYLDDLTLYLDTHKEDKQALVLYLEKSSKRQELKKSFASKFYPLTRDCILYCGKNDGFCWQDGPIPWEGGTV